MIINLGNRIVNNYLITGEGGHILIDTGYQNGVQSFQKKLKEAGIDPRDIKIIFLTHAHDDHAGFLNDVLAITDANVVLHPKAIEGLRRGQNSFEGGCSSRFAYFFCLVLAMLGKGAHRYPAIREEYMNRLVTIDSDAFRAMDLPFQVIETPGHTTDHIALMKDGILFCGDAAMNNFPSIHRVIIWIENLRQYIHSWETIININPVMLYPAHGKPFQTADLKKYLPSLNHIRLYPLRQR